MEPLVSVISDPTPEQLGMMFGAQRGDTMSAIAYSDYNPPDLRKTLELCRADVWRPLIWCVRGEELGIHWAHDFGEGFMWSGGYVRIKARNHGLAPESRGVNSDVQAIGWAQCRKVFERKWGFRSIFCAAMVDNTAADRWIVESCKFHRVRIERDFSLRQGREVDLWTYTQRKEDADECMRQADILREKLRRMRQSM